MCPCDMTAVELRKSEETDKLRSSIEEFSCILCDKTLAIESDVNLKKLMN